MVDEQGDGQVNVLARWTHLSVEGIGRETLVGLRLKNATVADVLDETLALLSPNGEVRYRAEGNKLTISTRADFERKLYTRVYDLTDLVARVPNFGQGAPQIDLQAAGQPGSSGRAPLTGGPSQDTDEAGRPAEQAQVDELTRLRELIEQTIEPDSWEAAGSEARDQITGRGRIRIFYRALVVVNSIEVHEQIAGLFSHGK